MIIFRNLNPIEVNEADGQIVLEVDLAASGISATTLVEISTIDGSANSIAFSNGESGLDFSAINSLTTSIDPNNADTFSFNINITNDAIAEPDENFQFQVVATEDPNLSGIATITIKDDDTEESEESELVVAGLLPTISINDVEQFEGDTGNTDFEFTISLSEPSEEVVTVDYSTADGTGESEARTEDPELVDPADYVPLAGTLEFNPGETEKTVSVQVLTDTQNLDDEAPEETFFVNLTNPNNADLNRVAGEGTILDDDLTSETDDSNGLPFLRLDEQTFVEGNDENTTQELTVNLVDADGEPFIASQDIVFEYSTVDFTAAANLDYEFVANQSATIPQGQSSIAISTTIIGDNEIESDEAFLIQLSNVDPTLVQFDNAESMLQTEITIQDDDNLGNEDNNLDGNGNDSNDDTDIKGGNIFRFFDSEAGVHFYTGNETERDFVVDNLTNYELENSNFASVDPDSVDNESDIYRFLNTGTGGHFYTADEVERDFIIDNLDEFVFEDVGFSAFETNVENTIPVYRFFEPNLGIHFYTAEESERVFVEDNLDNYNFEGIAFYALPAEPSVI